MYRKVSIIISLINKNIVDTDIFKNYYQVSKKPISLLAIKYHDNLLWYGPTMTHSTRVSVWAQAQTFS